MNQKPEQEVINYSNKTVALKAPKQEVFTFLSNITNITKWATDFAQELKQVEGKFKVVNKQGEFYFRIDSDDQSGVIDMFAGPTEEQMAYYPSRVIEIPGGHSLYVFTSFQLPGMSDEEFEMQCSSLEQEFENIKRIVEACNEAK